MEQQVLGFLARQWPRWAATSELLWINAPQKGSRFQRLGSRGPRGGQTSLRWCPRASEKGSRSVRKAFASVAGMSQEHRRSVTPKGRDPCNCRHFWTFACQKWQQSNDGTRWGRDPPVVVAFGALSSGCVSKVSSHRYGTCRGCHPRNCRCAFGPSSLERIVKWKVEWRVETSLEGGERSVQWKVTWSIEMGVESGVENGKCKMESGVCGE